MALVGRKKLVGSFEVLKMRRIQDYLSADVLSSKNISVVFSACPFEVRTNLIGSIIIILINVYIVGALLPMAKLQAKITQSCYLDALKCE